MTEGKVLARLILAEICKMEPRFICSSCLKLLFTLGFVSSCIGNNFTKKFSLKTHEISLKDQDRKKD